MMIGFTIPQLFQSRQIQEALLSSEQMEHLMSLRRRRSQSDLYSNQNREHEFWDKMQKKLTSPLTEQVGGSHYKTMKIQPIEFIQANDLGFCEGNAVKYLCRYKQKGGLQDLHKAKHYIEILIEMTAKWEAEAQNTTNKEG